MIEAFIGIDKVRDLGKIRSDFYIVENLLFYNKMNNIILK